MKDGRHLGDLHQLTFERVRYPSGEFKASCHCGWSATAEAGSDPLTLKRLEQMHAEALEHNGLGEQE